MPELSRSYFEKIEAPVKGYYVFQRSAHSPLFEEPERATKILREDVMRSRTDLSAAAG